MLRSSEFRKVYDEGIRATGPYFVAFCLRCSGVAGPRIGFTVPRALGKAVGRNRIKRRMREAVRRHLDQLGPEWEIVINPRRAALAASWDELTGEVQRLFSRCKA